MYLETATNRTSSGFLPDREQASAMVSRTCSKFSAIVLMALRTFCPAVQRVEALCARMTAFLPSCERCPPQRAGPVSP
jgi:hypothetical protein